MPSAGNFRSSSRIEEVSTLIDPVSASAPEAALTRNFNAHTGFRGAIFSLFMSGDCQLAD